jgi:hypothetical protein
MVNHHIYILSGVNILKKGSSIWNPFYFEWSFLVRKACCFSGSLLSSFFGFIGSFLLGGYLCLFVLRRLFNWRGTMLTVLFNANVALFIPEGPVIRVTGYPGSLNYF